MRVARSTFAAHGAAILDHAGRLFRGRGVEAVSVADISRAAGLTHGAFYGHFSSKAALAAHATRSSLIHAAGRWRERAASARAAGADPVAALIDYYLTERHRDAPETGCTLSAIGPELSRAGGETASALAEGAEALAAVLDEEIARTAPHLSEAARSTRVLGVLSAMVGGIALARALRHDPARSRAALAGAADLARRCAASD